MSYQDPPRRQRPPRHPASAQYEDGYYPSPADPQAGYSGYSNQSGESYSGFAGLARSSPPGAAAPPWQEPPAEQAAWEQTGSQTAGDQAGWQRPAERAAWEQNGWQRPGEQAGWQRPAEQAAWEQNGWQRPGEQAGWQRSAEQAAWEQNGWQRPGEQAGWQRPGEQSGWDARAQNGWGSAALESEFGVPRESAERQAATGEFAVPDHRAGYRAERRGGGRPTLFDRLAGAVAGFLAAAVAIGVANLMAAFVRPQASPIIAVGGAFIDRTPPALKEFAVEHFGENDKNVLLLGMYVTIAIIALVIGMIAWHRLYVGVVGIGLFGLFGAFVALTRPESHVTDVIPSIVGGIVGIATIIWLIRIGVPRSGSGSRNRSAWSGGSL